MNRKQGGKTSTGNHGEASGRVDTAEKGRIPVEEPMGDRRNVVNATIMTEDVMDVTHKEAAMGDDLESIQMGKGAGIQGDLFNEKLCEIDLELEKFDLERELTADTRVNVETECTKNGNTNNCGIVTEEANQELAAWENLNKKQQHVGVNEGSPNDLEHHVTGEKTKEQENRIGVAVKAASTWKRIVRKESNGLVVVPPLKALKRPGTELLNLELQKRRSSFLMMIKTLQRNWQGLIFSLARSNEYFMLELSWAWEPTDDSRARRLNLGTISLSRVPSQNMA